MKIVIRDKDNVRLVSYSKDNKPSGAICVKTKDKTVYFPLDKIDPQYNMGRNQQKLRIKHKGKEYGLRCFMYF